MELVKRFDAEWKTENVKVGSTIVPNTPMFDSVYRTFTDDEMKDINPEKTVYFLVRFEFTDETGTWRTESCRSYQRDPSAGVNSALHIHALPLRVLESRLSGGGEFLVRQRLANITVIQKHLIVYVLRLF